MVLGKMVLARAAGLDVYGLEIDSSVKLAVDYCIVNDGASHSCLEYFGETNTLYDNDKVAVIIDHDTPSGSEAASVIQRKLINFAKKFDTLYYHGEGVGYQLMIDNHVKEGHVVVGCGDHVSVFGAVGAIGLAVKAQQLAEVLKTGVLEVKVPEIVKIELKGQLTKGVYAKDVILTIIGALGTQKLAGKLVEFSGGAFKKLTLNDRITICNLASRLNTVSAFVNTGVALEDASYGAAFQFDLATIKASIARPDNCEDIAPVNEIKNVKVNQVFIGGCSGGRIEDLRIAAAIVRGEKVAKAVRLMVAPVTSHVYVQALQEGLIADFLDAGAVIMNQGCSVCWGKSQGIIDTDEVMVSAGSYNHKGCAGESTSKVYIASAATAATSAITGSIAEPSIV